MRDKKKSAYNFFKGIGDKEIKTIAKKVDKPLFAFVTT